MFFEHFQAVCIQKIKFMFLGVFKLAKKNTCFEILSVHNNKKMKLTFFDLFYLAKN
eukprot:UN17695